MSEVYIGARVKVVDGAGLDNDIHTEDVGTINAKFEDPEGNRYVMFQPKGKAEFYWIAEWRVELLED
jgi:hypothetical protein